MSSVRRGSPASQLPRGRRRGEGGREERGGVGGGRCRLRMEVGGWGTSGDWGEQRGVGTRGTDRSSAGGGKWARGHS